jgi:SAM-dependent methyltransferase
MSELQLTVPQGFDWKSWVSRWEQMQAGYLVQRLERFAIMVQFVRDTQETVRKIVDLGCGPGSLMLKYLEAFPNVQVYGIDLDPTLLLLARECTAQFSDAVHLLQIDMRNESWSDLLPKGVDVVVSATALHWLNATCLEKVYAGVASLLKQGGIFLNADHVGSSSPLIQRAWEKHREEKRKIERDLKAEDWDRFWDAYLSALGGNAREIRQSALGAWEGIEEGLPLAWHLDKLRQHGFSVVDCFWRSDCDAIYGGIRE